MDKPPLGSEIALLDHDGRSVTLAEYHGRLVLLFFGFTHCRKVCPRKLAQLSEVLERLEAPSDRLIPLYVSVDPERDTPQRMKQFLDESAPRFTGLTGARPQIEELKEAYQVHARKAPDPQSPGGYAVPHTAITYVLDAKGELIDHFLDGTTNEQIIDRLEGILSGNRSA